MQARCAQNIADMAPLLSAIAKCAKSNNGSLTAICDTVANLSSGGYLPSTYRLPTTANLASVTVTAAAAVITMAGTGQAGSCVVSIRPTVTAAGVTWVYTNDGGCDRTQTGVGT